MKTKPKTSNFLLGCALVLSTASSVSFAATFSDANWMSMGGIFGVEGGPLFALAVSGSNLYVGGKFTNTPGGVPANYIAQFDGTKWSPLGSGMNGDTFPGFNYPN